MNRTRTRTLAAGLALTVSTLTLATVTAAEAARPRAFANCDAMHRVYPHGVGLPKARDRTSGTPVTTFTRNRAVYLVNTKSDRDKDGIACEQA
jgi:hypothetical protein